MKNIKSLTDLEPQSLQQQTQHKFELEEAKTHILAEPLEELKDDDSSSGGCNSDLEIDEEDENAELDIDPSLPFDIQFPMRKTYCFGDITISSDFDGGNMRRCIWPNQEFVLNNSAKNESAKTPFKFDMWISWDGLPYRKSGLKTWFYFYVLGVSKGETVRFTIK